MKKNNLGTSGAPYITPTTRILEIHLESRILDMSSNNVPDLNRPDLGDLWG